MKLLQRLQHIRDWIWSYRYLAEKKKRFVTDIYVPIWWAQLTPSDIGRTCTTIMLPNDRTITVRVIDVETFDTRQSKGVHLNIEYADDCKYISQCTVKEFMKDYMTIIDFLVSRENILDLLALQEEIKHDA